MPHKCLIETSLLLLLIAPRPASANAWDEEPQPYVRETTTIERFTRSIITLYTASEKCRNVKTIHTETYTESIKAYMREYYRDNTPYWTLPLVRESVKSRNECVFMILEGLIFYQNASVEFANHYPDQPLPPTLTTSMMEPVLTYAPNQDNVSSQYRVTAPVLTSSKK